MSERWYYTDVIVIRGPDDVDEFSRRIASIASVYPGEIIVWKHDDDHIHLVHDCIYSSRRCRCRFRVDPFIASRIKKCPRRRRAITAMSDLDWFNILIYFFLQKRPSRGQVWIRGTHKRVPGESEIIQWVSFIEGSLSVLERENPPINDQLQQDLTRVGSRKWPHTKRKPISDYQRCNPETTAKKVLSILMSYNCIPPENIVSVIPSGHHYYINFIDPKFKRFFDMGLGLYKKTINELELKGLENLLCSGSEDSIFYSHSTNVFEYYYNLADSLAWLNKLLLFQFNDDTDEVSKFLLNLVSWFNRQGLYQWQDNNYVQNKKLNTLCIVGPPNSGKNWFFDCFISLGLNVGHIGRCNNKTNQFALQDAVNRRIIIGNEISLEEGAIEDFKKVCEGTACNIRVKYKGDAILRRTPLLLISNSQPIVCSHPDFNNVCVRTIRWKKFDELKNAIKKPYPLAFFSLLQMYKIPY
ncbi:uncharacterized protein LOC124711818 [Schistocerca piceifrons]|uniref:uncharacterized protein LOC124711818 n=1 Tax=Schistocerca piceifrons TaxID=274613 RepID=UPI001F5E571C|nr:uncharacterized protein LOC124711818 [Schistocerca piceifrons]